MTDVGEALRIYEEEDVIKTYNVRNEVEASHIASMLRWKYNQVSAVFTSIGPGGMQATAGSLVPLANGLGIYYLMGDETSQSEGPNMQQIPRREQELFLKVLSTLGPAYSLHTPSFIPQSFFKRSVTPPVQGITFFEIASSSPFSSNDVGNEETLQLC